MRSAPLGGCTRVSSSSELTEELTAFCRVKGIIELRRSGGGDILTFSRALAFNWSPGGAAPPPIGYEDVLVESPGGDIKVIRP